jgi:hypothetical protein
MNNDIKFHNFTNIENSEIEAIFDLGLKFIPQLSNKDTYIKEVLLCWYNFTNRLRDNTDCPHGLERYLAETKSLLLTNLNTLEPLKTNLKKPWMKKLKSLKERGIICVPTDKNLGVALIEEDEFLKLELKWLNDADLFRIDCPPSSVLKRLKKCIIWFLENHETWLSEVSPVSKLIHLLSKKTKLPLFKGILKIHKSELQIRPVIRENAGPIYVISKVVCPLLKELLEKAKRYFHCPHILSNSMELVKDLDKLEIPLTNTPWILFSADVKSMYPNFSKVELLSEVERLLSDLSYPSEKRDFILGALRLIFYNNYFTHDGKVFKTKSGIATGDPTSVMLANISKFLGENRLIKSNPDTILLYKRYVDDIFAIVQMDFFESFLITLNTVWEGLELTTEHSTEQMDFLDLRIYIPKTSFNPKLKHCKLQTKIYQKPQSLYQYLHWDSAHPREIYKGIYIGEICRYIRNCSNHKDFVEIRDLFQRRLLKRGWPKDYIGKLDRNCPKFKDRNTLLYDSKNKEFNYNRVAFKLPFNSSGVSSKLVKKSFT